LAIARMTHGDRAAAVLSPDRSRKMNCSPL
jgi:hypothetical protein